MEVTGPMSVDEATLRHEQRIATLERDHQELRRSVDTMLVEQRRMTALVEDQREYAKKASESLSTLLVLTERQTNQKEALDRAFSAQAAMRGTLDAMKDQIRDVRERIPERLGDRLADLEREQPTTAIVKRAVFGAFAAIALGAWGLIWGLTKGGSQ